MTRSQRMASILKLAERREREAAKAASQTRNHLLQFEDKLKELRRFRKEYAIGAGSRTGIYNAAQLHQQQRFIEQLDEGIRLLNQSILQQRHSLDRSSQKWMDAYRYSNSLDKLVDKMRNVEYRETEAAEQAELDDHTMLSHGRNRA